MGQYLARRLLAIIPVLVLVSIVVFSLLHITPGDPVEVMLGESGTPDVKAALRQELGLDRPIYVQYVRWIGDVVRGDFGRSIRTRQPLLEGLVQRLPVTLELAALSMVFALAIALPIGILSATYRGSMIDSVATVLSLAGAAVPNFVLAILLILWLSLDLRLLPPSGFVPFLVSPIENVQLMIMPAIGLGTHQAAVILRMVRSSMLEVLSQDYVRTARSKGLAEALVLRRHALRNALIPVITLVGLQIGNLLGGAVVTEHIFALPGIGRFVVDSITGRDYPVVQGVVLFMALVYLLANLLVDVLYSVVDPRITYQ